ncbi:hypothetical protein G9A89_017691 [Geosiphon pyriformis]|nr:hypothetical protein G9A89_017691 [Geosiphon pyriformis]
MLDWMTQELVLSQNATCGHFKALSRKELLIELEEEKEKPVWEAYQVSKLMPTINWKKKGKRKEEESPEPTTNTHQVTSGWTSSYSIDEPLPQPPYVPLKCKDCGKKLSSMEMKTTGCKPIITASCAIENNMAIQNDKASGTTNHVSLVANNYSIKEYGMTFLVKEKHVTLHVNTRSSSATG